MSFIDNLKKLEYLHFKIKTHSTGTPDELSCKLQKSRRAVYNMIDELKDMGADICYCRTKQSFIYKNNFDFSIVIKTSNILGGRKQFVNNILKCNYNARNSFIFTAQDEFGQNNVL